jgi:translation elongation factor P/translation initiation factor 5A
MTQFSKNRVLKVEINNFCLIVRCSIKKTGKNGHQIPRKH